MRRDYLEVGDPIKLPVRSTVMQSVVLDGPKPQFCLHLPKGALIRHIAGKTGRTPLGTPQEFLGIFIETEVGEGVEYEYRTFGFAPLNVAVGGAENLRVIYLGAILGMPSASELFLFEFPDVKPTQEWIDQNEAEDKSAEAMKKRSSIFLN